MPYPPAIEPSLPARLAAVLRRHGKVYRKSLKELKKKGPIPELVHAFRVASRRLLSALELAAAGAPGLSLGKQRERVRRRFKRLGPARDLQVSRELLAAVAGADPDPSLAAEAAAVDKALKQAEKAALKELKHALNKGKAKAGKGALKETAAALAEAEPAAFAGGAAARLRALADRVDERAGALALDRPETLHDLRIALKQSRYAVEALGDLVTNNGEPDRLAELVAAHRQWQDRLGAIQDLRVLRERVVAELPDGAGGDGGGGSGGPLVEAVTARRDGAIADVAARQGELAVLVAELRAAAGRLAASAPRDGSGPT